MKKFKNKTLPYLLTIRSSFLLILTCLLILSSCEETVDNPELPYEEQLVITAVLEAGKEVTDIVITRTLPPLEEYDFEKAAVLDAEAVIKSGSEEYQLISIGQGSYYAKDLIPEIGEQYKLEVRWKNLRASASTKIPDTISIEAFTIEKEKNEDDYGWEEWMYIVKAVFRPKSTSVYTAYSYNTGYFIKEYTNYAYRTEDTLKNGMISLPVYQRYFDGGIIDTNKIRNDLKNYSCSVESYDKPFYNYFLTRYKGNSDDNIFGTSGINIRGNINGGIGLFIGMASTTKKIEIE